MVFIINNSQVINLNIVLIEPKNRDNIATVIRSGTNFGLNALFIIGGVIREKYKGNIHKFDHQMNTQDGISSLALIYFETLSDFLCHLPAKTHVILIEQTDESHPIESFSHPKNATYVFGREAKGILPEEIKAVKNHITALQDRIPEEYLETNKNTTHCSLLQLDTPESLNLGVCASIVLYDRHLKNQLP